MEQKNTKNKRPFERHTLKIKSANANWRKYKLREKESFL